MRREISSEQINSLELKLGDFCERCFPKTYEYFISHKFDKICKDKNEAFDPFDYFISEKIPFLRYLITQYYRNNKLPALQFLNFATESDLEHLDELIYLYIKTGKKYYYKAAKEFYIYILERYIVRLSKGK